MALSSGISDLTSIRGTIVHPKVPTDLKIGLPALSTGCLWEVVRL